jgi:hypothetical protein
MSGQTAGDEAARLEAALARIARGAARAQQSVRAHASQAADAARLPAPDLPPTNPGATHAAGGPDTTEVAARLDALIAELRALLGTQG